MPEWLCWTKCSYGMAVMHQPWLWLMSVWWTGCSCLHHEESRISQVFLWQGNLVEYRPDKLDVSFFMYIYTSIVTMYNYYNYILSTRQKRWHDLDWNGDDLADYSRSWRNRCWPCWVERAMAEMLAVSVVCVTCIFSLLSTFLISVASVSPYLWFDRFVFPLLRPCLWTRR